MNRKKIARIVINTFCSIYILGYNHRIDRSILNTRWIQYSIETFLAYLVNVLLSDLVRKKVLKSKKDKNLWKKGEKICFNFIYKLKFSLQNTQTTSKPLFGWLNIFNSLTLLKGHWTVDFGYLFFSLNM